MSLGAPAHRRWISCRDVGGRGERRDVMSALRNPTMACPTSENGTEESEVVGLSG
jgi:hypothetical protein